MRWMSLPATRGQWGAMMRESARKVEAEFAEGQATPPSRTAPDEEGR
jgi:hypothetical protein